MPKRKKLPMPIITGLPSDTDNLIIQKSNPLQTLSESGLTLTEFKILDCYLSRIDSHNPDNRFVRFERGELEKLLNVSEIRKEDLAKRLKNLFQVVTIQDDTKPNGFTMIALFERAEAYQDKAGLWQVDLACTSSAMEYIFNVENLGYLKYRLRNVIELTSRYSYILYLYLENNRFRKRWTIAIDDLRNMLNCTADTYNQYYRFNDLVLKKCYAELTAKTDLQYTYEPTEKKGRKFTKIQFTVNNKSEAVTATKTKRKAAVKKDNTPDLLPNTMNTATENDDIAFFADALNNEFSEAEVKSLVLIARQKCRNGKTKNQRDLAIYDYLLSKYTKLNTYTRVKRRFAYLHKMIEQDTEEATEK